MKTIILIDKNGKEAHRIQSPHNHPPSTIWHHDRLWDFGAAKLNGEWHYYDVTIDSPPQDRLSLAGEPKTSEDIQPFADLLQTDQLRGLVSRDCDCDVNRQNCSVTIKMGQKFARVDIGSSGRYMVELATGEIYGIKAYGVVHRGHRFGTLDTIQEWDWSEYRATQRKAVMS